MKTDPKNFEHLTRLALRAGRLLKLAKSDAPAILIRNEALLILAAAFDLDGRREAKREFADWISRHPEYAPDGGALVDLRNDTIDECVEAVSAFEDESDRQFSNAILDVAKKVAGLKTTHACAELGGLPIEPHPGFAEFAAQRYKLSADPVVAYSVIVDRETNAETAAFLDAAKAKGFEIMIDEQRGKVFVRAGVNNGPELEALRNRYMAVSP